ncbi:MAG TPA: hypothetical protein VGO09_11210, partial [Flavisolibacter sp.]|nr:hypothetical protein [Flavisolibacter sp.]
MKKTGFFFIICFIPFLLVLSCSKNPDSSEKILQSGGRLKYGGSAAADGIEYYIITDSAAGKPSVYLSPENLPHYLQITSIDVPVKITYYYTGIKQFGMNPNFHMQTIHLI